MRKTQVPVSLRGIPEEVAREITVTLVSGDVTILEFLPVYRRYGGSGPRFERGIIRLDVSMERGN